MPKKLKEISGLAFLNDTVMVCMNDSGNDPELFFLNLNGEQIHKVTVENATNRDWEDITTDGKGTIYVGDIGNNDNSRTDLCVYKINGKGILKKETVKAEKISFSYPDQKEFPPELKNLHFDSEAMAFNNDSLYIYTKCRAEPWDGKCFCYVIPTKVGTYKAKKLSDLYIGKNGWWKDAVTGAEIRNKKCYLVTYNRILIYTIQDDKLKYDRKISLETISQYESIAVSPTGKIYVADERNKLLGGGKIYIVKEKKEKKDGD